MFLLRLFASTSEGGAGGSADSIESLKKIFTNPVLYIVLGALVLLLVGIYLIRRFIKARPNAHIIVVRHGRVHKVVDEQNPKYYLVPFLDSVGAIITDDEKEFSSDKLFINNGPDALYKINYTLKYKVLDSKEFYPHINNLENVLPTKINDELRLFADEGNALTIVKEYRQSERTIIGIINKVVEQYHIEVIAFKVNLIEPMSGR